ncbi:hypothetical protein N7457_009335 [Penicillium paradoxum]|uniref:uncharacterized protein n=1 Tax=Penicillium paradoxum TaxID=176176 RepID=UPI00254690A9|nr:uncharacterized protein N7457_009335 [Penicillium paradoxum]KAJ5774439.1 hypothetical protein N7457_009335 [Penicillium paradoxum]
MEATLQTAMLNSDVPSNKKHKTTEHGTDDTEIKPAWILRLPPELMNMIFSFSSVLSGASLALTCKTYHEQFRSVLTRPEFKCPKRAEELNPPSDQHIITPENGFYERTELLLRLETDKISYCGSCNKLYPADQFYPSNSYIWHNHAGKTTHRRSKFSIYCCPCRVFGHPTSRPHLPPPTRGCIYETTINGLQGGDNGKIKQHTTFGKFGDDAVSVDLYHDIWCPDLDELAQQSETPPPMMTCPHANIFDFHRNIGASTGHQYIQYSVCTMCPETTFHFMEFGQYSRLNLHIQVHTHRILADSRFLRRYIWEF